MTEKIGWRSNRDQKAWLDYPIVIDSCNHYINSAQDKNLKRIAILGIMMDLFQIIPNVSNVTYIQYLL